MPVLTLDRYFQFGFARNSSTSLGTGCVATGLPNTLVHSAQVTHFGDGPTPGVLNLSLLRGLPNAACWALLGLSNPNASLGLCEKLYASAEVTLSAPPLNSNGVGSVELRFPITSGMIGAKLFSQMVIGDPGQSVIGVALSNGAQTVCPAAPVFDKSVTWSVWGAAGQGWFSSSSLRKDGGLIIGL